jgi:hypothetical protein
MSLDFVLAQVCTIIFFGSYNIIVHNRLQVTLWLCVHTVHIVQIYSYSELCVHSGCAHLGHSQAVPCMHTVHTAHTVCNCALSVHTNWMFLVCVAFQDLSRAFRCLCMAKLQSADILAASSKVVTANKCGVTPSYPGIIFWHRCAQII